MSDDARLDVRACVLAVVAGLGCGALAAAFRAALLAATTRHVQVVEWLLAISPWCGIGVVALAATGAGLAGWLVGRFAPETSGSGIPHVEGRLADGVPMRWARVLPVKFVGGVLALGAGLSMGREGPTVQMGGALADAIARAMRVDRDTGRALLAAGAGAGLAAAFDAPLAGFVFVLEELRQAATVRMVTTGLLATLTANVVLLATMGDRPVFDIGDPPTLPASVLPLAVVVGLVAGLVGVAFNRALLTTLAVADRIPAPRWALTAAAGALAGVFALTFPAVLGDGELVTQGILGDAASGAPTTLWLVGVVVWKLVLTVASYASGAPGGIFAPLLLMGAATGSIVGGLAQDLAPGVPLRSALGMAGMTAIFTAVVRVPLTGIVLIEEMTSGQNQLLELSVAAIVAYLVAAALREPPVYEALLARDRRRERARRDAARAD